MVRLKLYLGLAAIALAANNSESPGKNGKMTAPVSINTMAKRIRYDQFPNVLTIETRCASIWIIKSIRVSKGYAPFKVKYFSG